MHIDIQRGDGCRRVILITADWSDVEQDYSHILNELKQCDIPGFRRGKAPTGIIEKRYSSAISAMFEDRVVRRLLREAAKDRHLGPVGLVEARDISFTKGDSFSFAADFDVSPDIELPDYASFDAAGLSDEAARDALSEFLLKSTAFDVPPSLVDEELRVAEDTPADPADADDSQRAGAEQRTRLLLILRKIADNDGIEIDDHDVEDRIASTAEHLGRRPEALRTELLQKGGFEHLRSFLLAEQTMSYILEA